ncbi:S49 family peptidase [Variovorax dokdonensis]|uniref:S49 family peptidase n=1 Tax=Variovorax dokdonensis TaxID=344883 RepID=A0ABT7N6P2_9BURK|nr:S49 family peptidase [Variovorax dokdonensis]MDM0043550.1 S49 family peptidase [Variovorax dokdonensis]
MTESTRTEPRGLDPHAATVATGSSTSGGDGHSRRAWERDTLERLAFAALTEQRAARRWKIGIRLAWLVLIAVVIWVGMSRSATTTAASTAPHTAMIEIKGEISDGADASAQAIVASMKSAFEDSAAKAVVLLINSPGGSPVQAGIVADEIRRMKAQYKKPVYAVVEESCTSAAYYIASATDKIFVNKASLVGSIGVLIDGFGFTGIMNRVGVERRLIISGENKGFLDPFSPMNDEQRAHAQKMIDQIHEQFISVVKAGRGDRLKLQTPGLFSGLFWTGEQAVEIGLADQLGSLDYVAREVVKAEKVEDYTRHENVAERLVRRFGATLADSAVGAMGRSGYSLR